MAPSSKFLFALTIPLLLPSLASAQVDPRCEGLQKPADYDEQVQQDFLSNYVALATTFSPLHGPIPHAPGHGAIGVDIGVIPPLSCEKRFVLSYQKTEDTNKTPIVPRPRITFAFPALGNPEKLQVHLYGGFAWVPPVPLLGTRNVIVSGEFGAGVPLLEDRLHVGLRTHATLQKTIGDVATKFKPEDADYDDLYLASTFGFDGMVGVQVGPIVPYLAAGFTDVSTFFYIGDDGVVTNNLHPYAGATFSLGVDGLVLDRFRFGGEFYGAPGGYSTPLPETPSPAKAAQYGSIYTTRFRVAVEI